MRRGVARQRRGEVLLLVFAVVAIFFYYRKTQQMTPLSEVRGETHSGIAGRLDNGGHTAQKQETVQPREVGRLVSTKSPEQPSVGRKLELSQTTTSRSSTENAALENDDSDVQRDSLVPDHFVTEKQTAIIPVESASIVANETNAATVDTPVADSTYKHTTGVSYVKKEEIGSTKKIDAVDIIAENPVEPVPTVNIPASRVTQRLPTETTLGHAVNNNAAITVHTPNKVNVHQSTSISTRGPVAAVGQYSGASTTTFSPTTSHTKRTENQSAVPAHDVSEKGTQILSAIPALEAHAKTLHTIDRQAVQTPAVIVQSKATATAANHDPSAIGEDIQVPSASNEPPQMAVDVKQTTVKVQPSTVGVAQKPRSGPAKELRKNEAYSILKPDSVVSVPLVSQSVQNHSVISQHKVDDVAVEDSVKSVTALREESISLVSSKSDNTTSTRPKPLTTISPRGTPTIPAPPQKPFDSMRLGLTSGRLSTLELINPKDVYKIGDDVVVTVKTRNQLNRPKRRGGDYLKARMFTDDVAASTPGIITDHDNGTYTVRFRAGWSGRAAVQAHVIHPREAIDVLRRLRDVERKRVNACGFLHDGGTEWTRCWTTPSRDPAEEECDFSHATSGTDWYCKKPARAPCSAIDGCSGGGLRPLEEIGVTETDKMLFNESFVDQEVMQGTTLSVQVTEQDVPCVIRHGSGNCLYASDPDVDGSDPLRRRVVLWPCTDSVRQVFVLRHDGKIVHPDSGLCVDVTNDNSTDNGLVVLRDCELGGLRVRRTESRAIQDVETLRCLHPHLDVQVPLDGSPVRFSQGCDDAKVVFEFMEDLSSLPKCTPGTTPSAGFYLHDKWYPYACRARQFPDRDSVTKCLTNKSVYMYGDSTVRQWFDHLSSYLGLTRVMLLPGMENCYIGPCASHRNSTNTHLHMMFHNFPIYGNPFKYHRMIYIADELDRLQGGPDVVVVITIWFHFLMEPVHIYRKRIVAIRDAILRLHQRQPETLVLIKSGNMAFSSLWAPTHVGNYLMADDWMSQDLDRVQREVFSPTRAVFLDVWGMTACHRVKHDIHPPGVIVAAEVRLMLAYICPT